MKPGYAFELESDSKWDDSPSDDWNIVSVGPGKAKYLGTRTIDGEMCTVWERDGMVYAQTATMAPAPAARAPRAAKGPKNAGPAIAVRRVKLNRGGYDSHGRYFGVGLPLWEYESDDGESTGHVRAAGKAAAKAEVRKKYPTARVR